jgi:transposase InsO family protein
VLAAHPGRSQGATNNPGLAAHRLPAAYPTLLPRNSPCPGTPILPKTPDDSIAAVSSPDNGSCYRAVLHALARRRLGIKHLRTRPYQPQTNGKAERFIRSLLAGWAYGPIYGSSRERTAALDGWLWHYNHRRKHSALAHQPPASRTKVLGSYT